MSSQTKQKRVCVIGAGAAGLVALKECKQEGFQVSCYELDSDIGGIWNQKDEGRSSNTPMVWETLYTNTTKYLTNFSDFPPTPEDSLYLTCHAMHRYYRRYAKNFNLFPHIEFNTRVVKVRKTPDHSRTGQWEVFTCPTSDFKGGDMTPGLKATQEDLARCKKEIFDFVLVCTGFFKLPKYPDVPGLESFQGPVQHSISYRTGKQYEDKTVLVVGNSLSAGDIANDISNHARLVYLCAGDGMWIWPRLMPGGKGLDTTLPRSLVYSPDVEVKFNNFIISEAQKRMDHYSAGICPPVPPAKAPIMIGDDIYLRIMSNRIQVYGRLTSMKGSEALFKDGSKVSGFDAVVVCTGYTPDFSFLEMDVVQENGKMDLFEMMFPVHDEPNTLGFVGMFAGDSSIAKVVELQSRYAAKIFSGKMKLPSKQEMQAGADFYNDYSVQRRGNYSYLCPCFVMADRIAQLLGVYPTFWRVFLRDPVLALRTWYGPQYTAQYRLLGWDSDWDAARQTCYKAHTEENKPIQHKPVHVVDRQDLSTYRKKQLTKMAVILPTIAAAVYFVGTMIASHNLEWKDLFLS